MQRKASSDRWRGGARYFRFRFRSLGKFCFLLQCASTLVEEKEKKKKAEIKQTRRKKGKSRVTVFLRFLSVFPRARFPRVGQQFSSQFFMEFFHLATFAGHSHPRVSLFQFPGEISTRCIVPLDV